MNTALPVSSRSISGSQIESCKATVFKVANHWLTLPATAILKVTSLSALSNGGTQDNKLMMWERQPLFRLNLHQILSRSSVSHSFEEDSPSNQQKYVLIVWSQTGDRCAISVDERPILLEIPLSEVQLLPPHYRQTISSIAKYMVTLTNRDRDMTILLLDLQQALHRAR